ncbi:g2170 [Coccomyxa elongata]
MEVESSRVQCYDTVSVRYFFCNVKSVVRWMLNHWTGARTINLTMHPFVEHLQANTTRLLDSIEQDAGPESHAPAALRVFRGTFTSYLEAHWAMMAKERHGSDEDSVCD